MDTQGSDLVTAKRSFNQDDHSKLRKETDLSRPKEAFNSSRVNERKSDIDLRPSVQDHSARRDGLRQDVKNSYLHAGTRNQVAAESPMGALSNQIRPKLSAGSERSSLERAYPAKPIEQKPFKIDEIHQSKLIEHRPSNYRAHNYKIEQPVKPKGDIYQRIDTHLPVQSQPRLLSSGRTKSPLSMHYTPEPIRTSISGNIRRNNPYQPSNGWNQPMPDRLVDRAHVHEPYSGMVMPPMRDIPYFKGRGYPNIPMGRYRNFGYIPQRFKQGGMFSPVRNNWQIQGRRRMGRNGARMFSLPRY